MNKHLAWLKVLVMLIAVGVWSSAQERAIRGTQPAVAAWSIFHGPDHDFTIAFPVRPQRDEDVQGPVTVLRRYFVIKDSIRLDISIQDLGYAPQSREGNEWASDNEQYNAEQHTREDGWKVIRVSRLARNISEIEAWHPSFEPGKLLHRVGQNVIRHGRIYGMGCSSLVYDKEVDKRVCRRFFNSLRVTGVPR